MEQDSAKLICPITGKIFWDPVKCADNQTYERKAFVDHYKKNGFRNKVKSPITDQLIDHTMKPDDEMKNDVIIYLNANPDKKCDQHQPYMSKEVAKQFIEKVIYRSDHQLDVDCIDMDKILKHTSGTYDWLFDYMATVDYENCRTFINLIVGNCSKEFCEFLIKTLDPIILGEILCHIEIKNKTPTDCNYEEFIVSRVCSWCDNSDIIADLICYGFDFNIVIDTKNKLRGIHIACSNKNNNIVNYLLENIPNLITNTKDKTFKEFARDLKNGEAYKLHEQYEAKKYGETYPRPTKRIFLKTLTGTTYTLRVKNHELLSDAKANISINTGISPCQMRWVYADKQLDHGKTLDEYGIQKDSTVHMVLRLCGG
jgi:hypothetical protein